MPIIHDKEFGDISIRRSHLAKSVRVSIAPNGSLRVSMPTLAPIFLAKRLIASSRASIRAMLAPTQTAYYHGQQIGKSHSIEVVISTQQKVTRAKQRIIVSVTDIADVENRDVQAAIRSAVVTALRREASSYLPKRLAFLAEQHGFSFERTRFSHASSRWGSCSSSGTISLNIALMRLPFELIDYVLIHELCHTKEMNHSERFWSLVAALDPGYKQHRAALKQENPSVL